RGGAIDQSRSRSRLPLLAKRGEGRGEESQGTWGGFFSPRPSTPDPQSRGFTIIEIALCLGIIAFALVAIIGALPTGLNVQKNNREQTIIGEDAQVWMDALRSGAQGFDDLTNYVVIISNQWTTYTYNGNASQYS